MEIPSTLCSNVYDFAFCPEPCYDRLVDLADPEDWGPGNRILRNYLSFSFSRAVFLTEHDVDQTGPSNLPLVFDDDRCLFNTGLYTRRYETIYGLFEPNTKPDARQRWFLKGFFKESDPMLVSFEYLPCRVRFAEDPSELVFDYRLPIRSNIDHILGDEENLTRIPASLMGEDNSLLLRRAFEGAVVEAARRAHLPHARHGLQQRATYLPPRDLVDKAVNGCLAAVFPIALVVLAWLAPTNLKTRAKSSW